MLALEAACVAIIGVYFVAHRADAPMRRDALLLAAAALAGEDSMIRAYGFYHYAPGWHLRVDQVPLLIPAIWAPVMLSARAVARSLLGRGGGLREALLTGALVTFDASLIEPIAVRAGLWQWTEPGVFRVPVIGIVGWGLFAAAATYALDRTRGLARLSVVPAAALATHAALLALWWGALRWTLRDELPFAAAATPVALASALYTAAVVRTNASLPWRELAPRAAATGFFAALLADRADAPLVAWAALFTPPWLVYCARALRRSRHTRHTAESSP